MRVRKFCLLATPRTGSSYLRQVLQNAPGVACHSELFNVRPGPDCFHREYFSTELTSAAISERDKDPLGFLARVEQQSLERASLCGFKLMLDHNQQVLDHVTCSEDYQLVVVYRANRLAQFSSELIARATDSWGTTTKGGPQVRMLFDVLHFERYRNNLDERYEQLYGNAHTGAMYWIEYNEIFDELALRKLFKFLGVSTKIQEAMNKASLVKQNTPRVVDRFANPQDVVDEMRRLGREDWLEEAIV